MAGTTTISAYDEIIQEIGNSGTFQRRYIVIFVGVLSLCTSIQYMNKILNITVPDHWCHVPGREKTNYTIEEWKNITIPIEITNNGIYGYSKCTRFANYLYRNETVKCDNGWEYDLMWYDQTAATQNDWVCDDNLIPTNVLAAYRVAEMIGTFVFGQLGDNLGRMPIFFTSVLITFIGRLALIFLSPWTYLFYTFSFLSNLPCSAIFHSTLIIAMEISGAKYRAIITMVMSISWGLGITISPLFMWWQRDWQIYSYITTFPVLIYLVLYKWMIESPRWLISRRGYKRCIKELNKIAKTNNRELPSDIQERLQTANKEEVNSNTYTVLSLFSSPRLAKNIIILTYSLASAVFTYMSLLITANNLNGNPYLNYVFLGIMDLPVFLFNKYGCDRFGRRTMLFFNFLVMTIGNLTMGFLIQDPTKSIFVTAACIITKCSAAMSFSQLSLQQVEICPTCIRQTGLSFVATVSNAICILGPYVIAIGITTNIMIPFFIYATMCFIAAIGCIFLPETLNKQLPDTLEEAAVFGAEQNIWGKKKASAKSINGEDEPLNNLK